MNKRKLEKMFFGKEKIFITLSIFVFIFCFVNFKAQTANAIVGVFVPVAEGGPNLVANTTTAAGTQALVQKEFVLDGIVTQAAKIVIQNLTNSIVRWINSGFEGGPAFITNPGSYFTDVADQIAGNFIASTDAGFICQPFALDIKIALAVGYNAPYLQGNYCRLSDAVKNTENFAKYTAGDFSKGGWDSWFEISQNAQNNPMGAYLAADRELSIRTASGVALKLDLADWGKGFISQADCIESDPQTKQCRKYGPITTPGSVIESQLENTLGTGIRQLELANEINQVVNALVGQLAQTVLTQGLSSFGGGGKNANSLDTLAALPLTANCSPSAYQVSVGQSVTWRASSYGGGDGRLSYSWSGEVVGGASGDTVSVIYDSPGTKSAAVIATKGAENLFQFCSSSVTVTDSVATTPPDNGSN